MNINEQRPVQAQTMEQQLDLKPTHSRKQIATVATVGILSLAIALGTGWALGSMNNDTMERTMNVLATGTKKVKSNKVIIQLEVSADASSEDAVKENIEETFKSVKSRAEEKGVPTNKVTLTDNFYGSEKWDDKPVVWLEGSEDSPVASIESQNTQDTYEGTQTIKVELESNEKIEEKASELTAYLLEVKGVSFEEASFSLTEEKEKDAEQEARNIAIKNAKEQAKDNADTLDLKVGKILGVNKNTSENATSGFELLVMMESIFSEEESQYTTTVYNFSKTFETQDVTVAELVSITYQVK